MTWTTLRSDRASCRTQPRPKTVLSVKINRLLEITLILLNKGTVTAAQLAERFGVSARTIYRDIDELSSAGVPVFASKGGGGGISLLENYAIEVYDTRYKGDKDPTSVVGILVAIEDIGEGKNK